MIQERTKKHIIALRNGGLSREFINKYLIPKWSIYTLKEKKSLVAWHNNSNNK